MLSNVIIGDRVKSCLNGWGTVCSVSSEGKVEITYPSGLSEWLTREGKYLNKHKSPVIIDVEHTTMRNHVQLNKWGTNRWGVVIGWYRYAGKNDFL